MTDRERAIVMAYTGVAMLVGDKLCVFYDYVSEKLGRPVMTHELYSQADMIKELVKEDFLGLCAGKQLPKPELGKLKEQEEKPLRCKTCTMRDRTRFCHRWSIEVKDDDYCSFGAWKGW